MCHTYIKHAMCMWQQQQYNAGEDIHNFIEYDT